MPRRALIIFASLFLGLTLAHADPGKIRKVLPHFLDKEGRHMLSPSLYERDAYQAVLRKNPELRSALRFDVLWSAPRSTNLVLRVEMRGTRQNQPTSATISSAPFPHRGGRSWRSIALSGDDYRAFGELLAWRVTLWNGDQPWGEQKSFLW